MAVSGKQKQEAGRVYNEMTSSLDILKLQPYHLMESELYTMRSIACSIKPERNRNQRGVLQKSSLMKTGRLKTSGVLFMLSGVVWFLAAALGKQSVFVGVGVAYLCVGACFIARSRKSITS